MVKKQIQKLTLRDIDKLLAQQTGVILDNVDKRLEVAKKETDRLLNQQTLVILNAVDKRLEQTRKELKGEINKLRISIDRFVGFYTKQDQEFTIMKEQLKRLEARIVNLEAKLT